MLKKLSETLIRGSWNATGICAGQARSELHDPLEAVAAGGSSYGQPRGALNDHR